MLHLSRKTVVDYITFLNSKYWAHKSAVKAYKHADSPFCLPSIPPPIIKARAKSMFIYKSSHVPDS